MRHPLLAIPAIAAALIVAQACSADPGARTSPGIAGDEPIQPAASQAAASAPEIAPSASTLAEFGAAPAVLGTVAYEPRSRYYPAPRPHRVYEPTTQTQLHSGFFQPDGGSGTGFVLGMRGGPMLSKNVQIGMAFDWEYRSEQQGVVVGSAPGPGGTPIVTQRQLFSASESTFPLMAYLQISAAPTRVIVPYVGIGGGYEFLTLSATDYTGYSFYANYGGWGWQTWAGARIPFAGHAGLLGEVYWNDATVHRDVFDPISGFTYRESVSLSGVGGRFGLSWAL
jgi:hypothetical protein